MPLHDPAAPSGDGSSALTALHNPSIAAFAPLDPHNPKALLDQDRFRPGPQHFDRLIQASYRHNWSVDDTDIIDFDQPFDLATQQILPDTLIPALHLPEIDRLLPPHSQRRRAFANETARWMLSAILYGEQAALTLSASLVGAFASPGAQEYAANQAREEARHVAAFSRYITVRFGGPLPCGDLLAALVGDMVSTSDINKKIVGMQILVEGLAMGTFAMLYRFTHDPLLKRLVQLVMRDEIGHHQFGRMWALHEVPKLDPAARDALEDWAASCYQSLMLNLLSPEQMHAVYDNVGLDWRIAQRAALAEPPQSTPRPTDHILRVLVRTLRETGLVTSRTSQLYRMGSFSFASSGRSG